MKKYKSIVLSSLLALALITSPILATATTYNDGEGGTRAEVRANAWSKFFGWYRAKIKIASAQAKKQNTTPVINGIKAPTVLKTGEVGEWTVRASDPQDSPLTYSVDWGDEPMLKSLFAEDTFVQTSTFEHVYENPGKYKVVFIVTNESGKRTKSSVTVNVKQGPEQTPVISNLMATGTETHEGLVTWTTDLEADSRVWLSDETPADLNREPDFLETDNVTSHSIVLDSLQPNTTYYLVVGSKKGSKLATSIETSFKTKQNLLAPVISSLTGTTTAMTGETVEVTIEAYDPQNSPLSYSVDWGDEGMLMRMMALFIEEEIFTQTSTFDHIYENPGTYTATFKVKNDLGLETSSSLEITVTEAPEEEDITPPVFSNIPETINTQVASSTASTTVSFISPTATDDVDGDRPVTCNPPSGSMFAFGTTSVICSASDLSGNNATTSFNVVVTEEDEDNVAPVFSNVPADFNLLATSTAGTSVNFTNPTATDAVDGDRPVTCSPPSGSVFPIGSTTVSCSASDLSGNNATTSFGVLIQADTVAPIITNVVENIGSSTTTVSWMTNKNATSKVFYSTISPLETTATTTSFIANLSLTTSHSLSLENLATSTLYNFVIESTDASNNTATSSEMSFTTGS